MQTDYEKVVEKLRAVGALLLDSFLNSTDELEPNCQVDFWNVQGKALIVVSFDNDDCGLYSFIGISGEPIENDLEFIKRLAQGEVQNG